jgi:hypothetical protein
LDLQSDFRHEDVLQNLGISGCNFTQQNEALVIEMTWKFLDYTKSARLEAADSEIADRRHAESEPIEIQMTSDGFPIIPKLVMEKELRGQILGSLWHGRDDMEGRGRIGGGSGGRGKGRGRGSRSGDGDRDRWGDNVGFGGADGPGPGPNRSHHSDLVVQFGRCRCALH